MRSLTCSQFSLCLLLMGTLVFSEESVALAQIVPDNTLGAESSVVVPNVSIDGLPSDQIEGGALRGELLFHSFGDFNIAEGRGAYFANPAAVNTIFSRVTGANPSDILGTLGVLGDADLVFLNPNGILFGPNARLDLRGSFTGSTASGIEMPNGDVFSALAPEVPSLLTLNTEAPIGLVFEGANAQVITNEGILVTPEDLTLAANTLDLRGQLYAGQDLNLQAQNTVQIRDSEQSPFIAASGYQLTVQGNQAVDIFALNHPESGLFSGGNMTLRSKNPVNGDAHYWSSGNFQIEQTDDTLGNLFSENDPIIRSQGDVSFFGYQGTSLHILSGGSVDVNTIIITAPDTIGESINPRSTPDLANIILSNGIEFEIDGSLRATVDIRAGMDPQSIGVPLGTNFVELPEEVFFEGIEETSLGFLLLDVQPPNNNTSVSNANITIGDIAVFPPDGMIYLSNQYLADQALSPDEASIFITGEGLLSTLGNNVNGIDAQPLSSIGNSADIILDSRSNIILSDSQIIASSNSGESGSITLLSAENILLHQGSQIASVMSAGSMGQGGDILVRANNILLEEGSNLITATDGSSNAGNIDIQANDTVALSESQEDSFFAGGVFSEVLPGAEGNGGNISISAEQIIVVDGAEISASTRGSGDSGNLNVQARSIMVSGEASNSNSTSRIASEVKDQAIGAEAGNLNITTSLLRVLRGANISASTFGIGNAGDLNIIANDIQISGVKRDGSRPSGVFSQVNRGATGNGGIIRIDAEDLRITDGGQIGVNAFAEGEPGQLEITSESIELRGTSSDIETLVGPEIEFSSGIFSRISGLATSDGKTILIDTGSLEVLDGASIETRTFGDRDAANIFITADSIAITGTSRPGENNGLFYSSTIDTGTLGTGSSGDLSIITRELFLSDGGQIAVGTLAQGNGATLSVKAESITLQGTSQLLDLSEVTGEVPEYIQEPVVYPSGLFVSSQPFDSSDSFESGNAGNLIVETTYLNAADGGLLSTETFGSGNAGRIVVRAREISLSGIAELDDELASGFFASVVRSSGEGDGGSIDVTADLLSISRGAEISVEALGLGNAGDITIETSDLLINSEGLVSAATSGGMVGSIFIFTDDMKMLDGGRLLTSKSGPNNAGNITLSIRNEGYFSGESSGIFSETLVDSSGRGGSIIINPILSSYSNNFNLSRLSFENGAVISVNSQGTGQGGNITLNSGSLSLNNASSVSAQTFSDIGGNISIRVPWVLLLRQNSGISTNSGSGSGGNISIDGGFIFAVSQEDSDITANAIGGDEGLVTVNADGIFGIEFRDELTPFSDITASSEQGNPGIVNINTPDVDPIQGLTVLPEEPREVVIIDNCQNATTEGAVAFFDLGQGGSPPSPDDIAGLSTTRASWISLDLLEPNISSDDDKFSRNDQKDTTYSLSLPTDSARPLIMSCP